MAVWSEVSVKALFGAYRLDAECYTPEMIGVYDHLAKLNCVRLGDHAHVTDGQHGYHKIDPESPIRHLTARCIKDFFIDDTEAERLALETHQKNLRSSCVEGDVLLSTAGTLGNAAIVTNEVLPANMDQDVARIHLHDSTIDPWYLVAFLDSHVGRLQSERVSTGQVQKHIALEKIREFSVPVDVPQARVAELGKKAYEERAESQRLYAEADALLLKELGLSDLDLSPQLFYERRYSETVAAHRLDAEYFQPKYYRVLDSIRATKPKQIVPLGSLLSFLTNGHTPLRHDLSVGEIPFLTAEHVYDFRVDYESEKRILGLHHDGELKRTRLTEGDILITIKGKIGNAAVVDNLPGPTNINQDVALARVPKQVPAYYIAAYLNSIAGKALVEQICTGQINPFFGLGNLRQLPIPVYDGDRMQGIARDVQETVIRAYAARQESQRLLIDAKRMVEEMILSPAA